MYNEESFKQAKPVYKDELGNLLIMCGETVFGNTYICCVYRPNKTDVNFYKNMDKQLTKLRNKKPGFAILAGDWNCVLSELSPKNNPNIINGKTIPNILNCRQLKKLMYDHSLIDAFRLENHSGKAYTYKHYSDKLFCKTRLPLY